MTVLASQLRCALSTLFIDPGSDVLVKFEMESHKKDIGIPDRLGPWLQPPNPDAWAYYLGQQLTHWDNEALGRFGYALNAYQIMALRTVIQSHKTFAHHVDDQIIPGFDHDLIHNAGPDAVDEPVIVEAGHIK